MHGMRSKTNIRNGPETTGATLHKSGQYDLHTRLLGLGVNRSNSRMIVEMAQIKPGDTVLDVGCGTGNLTLTAKSYVGKAGFVYGLDASPEMIDEAQRKAKRYSYDRSDVIFEVGLIEKLPYPDATFDIVISRLVIHHLPDDLKRQGFAEIFRVLKPGRRIFIADFNPPANLFLAHIALVVFGHRMMRTNVWIIPPMLKETGFIDITSGPTRSPFLAFVTGKKPGG